MGKDDEIHEVVEVEYIIWMHCNACERNAAKAISKIKGVEKFMTDMKNHRVVVTGRINPDKVLKKLRKKTGRRVEILPREEIKNLENQETKEEPVIDDEFAVDTYHEYSLTLELGVFDECYETNCLLTMFNDENVHACLIM